MLTGVLDVFATGTYAVSRRGPGTLTAGRLTRAAGTTLSISASVQPVDGRTLQALPEGQRAEESRVIYTATELRTRGPAGEADDVTIDGEPWTVTRVERWDGFGETYFRAFVARQVQP